MNPLNQLELQACLIERQAMRHTPAGIPVVEACLQHESQQIEAGSVRKVNVEISAIALGDVAKWLQAAPVGVLVQVKGFLAAKSRNSKMPILHIQQIEFLEGK